MEEDNAEEAFASRQYQYISKTNSNEIAQSIASSTVTEVQCTPEIMPETMEEDNAEEAETVNSDEYYAGCSKKQWTSSERQVFIESGSKAEFLDKTRLWDLRMEDLKFICKRFGWGTNGIKEKIVNRIVRRCEQELLAEQEETNNPYFVEPGISEKVALGQILEEGVINEDQEEVLSPDQEDETRTLSESQESQEDPLCTVYSAEHVVKNGKLTV